ncbi:MAG: hypothetical protein M3Y65_23055 [Pseudomonadota bacterium]|nr:hypothetical protein [Pseudomonadota bacterium]
MSCNKKFLRCGFYILISYYSFSREYKIDGQFNNSRDDRTIVNEQVFSSAAKIKAGHYAEISCEGIVDGFTGQRTNPQKSSQSAAFLRTFFGGFWPEFRDYKKFFRCRYGRPAISQENLWSSAAQVKPLALSTACRF